MRTGYRKRSTAGDKTICLPLPDGVEYETWIEDGVGYRQYLNEQIAQHPELFPPEISQGYWLDGYVESKRTVGLKTTTEKRYFLMSLPLSAQRFAEVVRGHWGLENQLHWVLDVAFREDDSKVAQGYAPENLAVLRHIALNLMSQEKSLKAGTRAKRMRAGWDDQYLFRVLANHAQTNTKL